MNRIQIKDILAQLNEIDRYEGYEVQFTEVKTINSVKIYGTRKEDEQVVIYLWDVSGSYVKYKGAAYEVAGGGYPMVIRAQLKKDGRLVLSDIMTPDDENDYVASIREMFPEEYAERVLTENMETYEKLRKQQEKQIKEHWGVEISEDHFALDESNGQVLIVESIEGYDKKGKYFYKKKIVDRGYLEKKTGGEK